MERKVADSLNKLKRLSGLVEKNFSGRFIYFKKKNVFAAIKRFAKMNSKRRHLLTAMTQVFSNYQQRVAMVRYKEFVSDKRSGELMLKDQRYHKKVENLQTVAKEHDRR